MSLKEQLQADLKDAMRQRDDRRRDTLRYTLASLHNAEIAEGGELDDGSALNVVAKDVKRRHESIEAFRKGGRDDLVAKEEAEIAILSVYLPERASRDEIADAARAVIAEVGAAGAKDLGKVMPVLLQRFRGRADGRDVNDVVRELLSAS
jgi:uncharacterized protein YqeY